MRNSLRQISDLKQALDKI